uniref:Uncharacterized protein n=1 Tax=Anguilla anguilla TaxID=7936 RepID=A0A0E9VKB6_ANGAN
MHVFSCASGHNINHYTTDEHMDALMKQKYCS